MVEDGRKRGRTQRGGIGHASAVKGRQALAGGVAAADHDSFAAFTSKYRDMLRFADADEAEAVYSMVSLTQAGRHQLDKPQNITPDVKGAPVEVPEVRAAKRRQLPPPVPAASACSEGGRSDSSAKSAPGPPPMQHWQYAQHGPSTAAPGFSPGIHGTQQPQQHLLPQPQLPQQQRAPCGAAVGGTASMAAGAMGCDIHPGALAPPAMTPMGPVSAMNMNMGPLGHAFLPAGCLPGMMGPPGAPGPLAPMMPPWAMLPPGLMHPMMFGGMPLPPGMMVPGPAGALPPMPMPFMQGMPGPHAAAAMASGATAAEPAAGIPISGPVPTGPGAGMATGVPAAGVSGKVASNANAAAGKCSKQCKAPAPAAGGIVAAFAQPGAPAAAAGAQQASAPPSGTAAAAAAGVAQPSLDMFQELEQLDVVALRPWVLSHFCEDVYLLLLDAWRPDSPKVKMALRAWKLHIKSAGAGAEPDYRAFLVSLFGLEKLLELTAADRAIRGDSSSGKASSGLPSPVLAPAATPSYAAAKAAGCADAETAATNSNLSSDPGATLTAPGPHIMSQLSPASAAVGCAASPHVVSQPARSAQAV